MSLLTISAAVIVILIVLLQLLLSADVLGALMAWIGNPILRKCGLQSAGGNNSEFIGQTAKVIEIKDSVIRVEFKGTSWKALPVTIDWMPNQGDSVCIAGVDGITLQVSKRDNQS